MGRARHVIWPNRKTLYFSYSYTVILTSILAAGIVQNTFAGEAGEKANAGGEVETTGGYFYQPGRKFFQFCSN